MGDRAQRDHPLPSSPRRSRTPPIRGAVAIDRLKGKTAIVTGASSGIGRAIADAFVRDGAHVVYAARRILTHLERVTEPRGGVALSVSADVTDRSGIQQLVATTLDRFGRIDVLVNAAGIQLHGLDGPCHLVDPDTWDRTIMVNLRGTFLVCREVLPVMMRQSAGSILNLSSPTALTRSGANYAAYASSKGGILSLTRSLASAYGSYGIRVNAIIPGPTETPLVEAAFREVDPADHPRTRALLGRTGSAAEQTGLAVYLASDESAYATGGVFHVDGGVSL